MRFSPVAALLLSISAASFAQEFRSTLSGVVADPAGAIIPNVTVIATETRTGIKTQTVSDSAGHFQHQCDDAWRPVGQAGHQNEDHLVEHLVRPR